jgi:hypothetical protein
MLGIYLGHTLGAEGRVLVSAADDANTELAPALGVRRRLGCCGSSNDVAAGATAAALQLELGAIAALPVSPGFHHQRFHPWGRNNAAPSPCARAAPGPGGARWCSGAVGGRARCAAGTAAGPPALTQTTALCCRGYCCDAVPAWLIVGTPVQLHAARTAPRGDTLRAVASLRGAAAAAAAAARQERAKMKRPPQRRTAASPRSPPAVTPSRARLGVIGPLGAALPG